ncbi:MAG: efflux RND transporter permease subunit, partial [Kiritimatiellia bacterium]|nr:efflux RND transporter permease subunit [Kiritimatiellia bacterium]
IDMRETRLQIRVPGEFKLAGELDALVIATRGHRPIRLRDIASVSDTFKDIETLSRVNGEPSVTLQIKKRSGENSVKIIDRIQAALSATALPPGLRVTATQDQAIFIRQMVSELENNIFSGFLLVVIVIFLVLGGRNSLLVGVAIPLSMLLSFILLTARGLTLNMIVLFSLVMAVGMLVDNAIVIVENIYRNHMDGHSCSEASRIGAGEVAWPVLTSTLTTIAVFVPLLYWPGIMGQFMGFLPRTLILVLIASLFVALTINPALCSLLIRRGKVPSPDRGPSRYDRVLDAYERLLRNALRHRGWILLFGLLFLILSAQIYRLLDRGLEQFPDVEPRSATVSVRFPQGTPLLRTDELLRRIEDRAAELPDVKFMVTTVGVVGGAGMGGGVGSHVGAVTIEFVDAVDRQNNSRDLLERLRTTIGQEPGAEIKVSEAEMGPPTGAPISLELSGDDFETLSDLSSEIQRRMKRVPGVVDVQDDFEDARPEIQFRLDRARAASLGLDTSTVGDWLRSSLFGSEATKFRAGEDQVDITLRLPLEDRADLGMLRNRLLTLPDGRSVPLSSLGRLTYAAGRGEIRRKDQKRMITITADRESARSVDRVIQDIREKLSDLTLPSGYRIDYAGDTKDMKEDAAFLGRAFAVAIGLIAIILVTQFNSLLLPVIILFSVLLSMIGVLWGLILCGMRFSVIMTGVGVISLAGVVVNNSIVLVDCMNRLRAEGLSADEAIIQAGRRRLRPVLLTAITTILGLIPMAIGWSLDIHTWPPTFVAGAESSTW